MVPLLPIPINNCNILQNALVEQRQTNREVLNDLLRRALHPLTCKPYPSSESRYYSVLCADGNFRRWNPVVLALLADCTEYTNLDHLEWHVGSWCECQKTELGDYVHTNKPHSRRDHNLYRTLSDANAKGSNAELLSRDVHRGFNVFQHILSTVNDLPKPHHLHTMQIGMLDHLQKWIFHILKTHERHNKYSAIWLSVPAYHDLIPTKKSYTEVSQWNGKEMGEMSRYWDGVVIQSLRGGSHAQRSIINHAIECPQGLLEFYMYVRYESHNDATLSYMEDAMRRFHNFKNVFILGRAGKKAKAKAKALRRELVKKRKVHKETKADSWTASKKWCEMNAWQDYISHKMDIPKELDADFNFPKIHLISDWAELICRYGALQQYLAERHEQPHNTNPKDGWNASNHNLNYLPQVITFQRHIQCFEIRELNHKALTQH